MNPTLLTPRASIGMPAVFSRFGGGRLLLGGLALVLISAGLAWQWSWLVAIGVAPLLVSAAPCVAMCALGLCMHRMCGRSGTAANEPSQNFSPRQED